MTSGWHEIGMTDQLYNFGNLYEHNAAVNSLVEFFISLQKNYLWFCIVAHNVLENSIPFLFVV